jgi:hypothetical protein
LLKVNLNVILCHAYISRTLERVSLVIMSTSSTTFVIPAVALGGPPLRGGSKPKRKRKSKRYQFSTPKKAKQNKAIAKAKAQEKAQAPPAAVAQVVPDPKWSDQNPPPPPPSPPPQQQEVDDGEDEQDNDQPQGSALFYDPYAGQVSNPAWTGPVPQSLHGDGGVLNTDVDELDVGQCIHDDYSGLPLIEKYDW